ncbi:uro-adherence factor A isoform X1 [Schistocerca nitens]|uniref:uro-adherence factor A isoform X1 n=1 Tax=Schistocerca nitens TaxID=7011 RepID=UPI0021189BBD|nr:uro-adherence factor A isoform X1 [Schistocerca nitens]XP_049813528.1 uro-adherence factor A isoform X1 [Schistocerca nitens]
MSSPKKGNARHLSKTTELSGPVQNSTQIENPDSPKKEKDSMHTQIKNPLKSPDNISDIEHNHKLPIKTEKSCLQTSSCIVSKKASHQNEPDSPISSCGYVESTQSELSDISYTKKTIRQKKQYSQESLKEHTTKNLSKGKEENTGQLNSHLPYETKNAEENNCKIQTTIEMYETSESLLLNTTADASTGSSVDKKKERRKIVKKLAKDEKRKQRELEYKKNLQYPKGQRIQIIDHNTFHKILKDSGSLQSENKRSLLNSEEFPALNVLKRNDIFPVMTCRNSSMQSESEKSRVQDKATNNMGKCMKISETHPVVNEEMINKVGKKFYVPSKLKPKGSLKKLGKLPKKRDPIQIDILQCIKMVKSKDAVLEPRKKVTALERRNDNSLLGGNELDSSNPQRSRGKKREKPKKKRPTRLKLVILHERQLKNQLKKLQESDLLQAEKVCFGTEKTINLLTTEGEKLKQVERITNVSDNESKNLPATGSIKLEHVEPAANVPDNGIVKTVPESMCLPTTVGLKVEQVKHLCNCSDSEGVETVPVSANLLTTRCIKLEKLEPVTNISDNKVVETVPGSTNLLATGGIKLNHVEPAANVPDNGIGKTVPGSMCLPTAGGLKLEQLEHLSKMPDNEAVETVPGSRNLLTTGCKKLEKLECVTNMLDSEVVETVPGFMNLLTEGGIKLEKIESVTDVPDNGIIEAMSGETDMSKEGRHKCEAPSSDSRTAAASTNQFLNAEDDSQTYTLSSLHINNNQPYSNERGRVPDLMPSLLYSATEILKKEKQEFISLVKESSCIVNLKQGQYSVATAGDDIKPTHISSNAIKREIILSSPNEHCTGSVENVSFTDTDTSNKLHQIKCIKFPKGEDCDSLSHHEKTIQKTEIHSRKFRPYCDHFITPEINSSVTTLLQDVVKFHDRQFERDPVKANARRRHVSGLREVLKYLNLKRLKLIIIAPDMELIEGKGGICDIVEQLKEGARKQEIPYVFALQRRSLGKITFKKVPVSCIGIINYDGTEKNFHSLVAALQVARLQYQEALTDVCFKETQSEEVDINKQVIEAALSRLTENSSTSCLEQRHLCAETDQEWEE